MFFEQPATNVTFVNFIVEYILSIPQFLRSFLTAYPKAPKANDPQNLSLSLSLSRNFQERGNSHILIAYQYRFQTEYVYKVIKVNLSISRSAKMTIQKILLQFLKHAHQSYAMNRGRTSFFLTQPKDLTLILLSPQKQAYI